MRNEPWIFHSVLFWLDALFCVLAIRFTSLASRSAMSRGVSRRSRRAFYSPVWPLLATPTH